MNFEQILKQQIHQTASADVALDYLAEILVQSYMKHKQNELNNSK